MRKLLIVLTGMIWIAQPLQAFDLSQMTDTERQVALERISIRHSIENLRTFPCVSILEKKDRLHLHGAWFDISEGQLWIMDPETKDFTRSPTVLVDQPNAAD